MRGFGITENIVILVIVLLLFGTKKLRSLGSDLGGAIKGFRKAMDNDSKEEPQIIADEVPDELAQDALSSESVDTNDKVNAESNQPR